MSKFFCFSFCPFPLSLYSAVLVLADAKMEKYDFDLIFGCHVSYVCLLSVYALTTCLSLTDFPRLLFLLTCLWTVFSLFRV